ncbi:MAG: radical SAM family heme chaperone HemW [Edaphobacter sp.]|uniref:radical SAM family heme chaperone HemW n=1 Tax=Edaphobacter sp. TaxID=1934404 RepID=UPI002391D61A|nr:radical SAM family heme chaperone HemW [Edaphobacter sp.]MDE1175330.1 radical SAM family heme chaperone HemW [Edaphobacter sp.]
MDPNHPVGLYLAVPFCKAKCSFCNFASDAFAPQRMDAYVDRLCTEVSLARDAAAAKCAILARTADSIYFGGGTPSLLSSEQFRRIFTTLGGHFDLADNAETTIECAPGQLSDETLDELLRQGVNRISLGVQSFLDREAAAVGRLHTGKECESEIQRLRSAGIAEVCLDLIVGLPHQTENSWRESLQRAIASGVTHISVYMLEVDEDSRLGREVIEGGARYGAAAVPDEDTAAAWYELGCSLLEAAGVHQYEISNFSRTGHESRHNSKYWRRQPYIGFGLDAHSMLLTDGGAVRFQNTDDLDSYSQDRGPLTVMPRSKVPTAEYLTREAAFEESLFLGLRMSVGVDIAVLRHDYGDLLERVIPSVKEIEAAGLLTVKDGWMRLTQSGRMASNEVFSRLLIAEAVEA